MLPIPANTNINFLSKPVRYFCLTASALMVIASITLFIQRQDTAYGIDFSGGQIQEYKFEHPVKAEDLRKLFEEAKLDVIIQQFAEYPDQVLLRSSDDIHGKIVQIFSEKMPDNKSELLRLEKVGPVVGKNLRERAAWALLLALAGILVYVGFRFKHFDFATAGVIALLHDVILPLGILIMLHREIDLLVVTALLTIAGYSINDTIVIYDRVRENMAKSRKNNLTEIINLSLNQTLGRTILTNLATFLVVISLYLKGGEVLNTFALCLMIGFVCGTYSTIFIVSPIVLAWQRKP